MWKDQEADVFMKVTNLVVSMCATNCYIAYNENTLEGIIVDPGDEAKRIIAKISDLEIKPVAILLTHGHFDHAGACADIAAEYDIPVYAAEAEKETLINSGINLSEWTNRPVEYHADEFLKDEQEVELAGFKLRMLLTPGHTMGGCCYYFPYEGIVFTGDSLFAGSVGRTDFPGGSMSTLVQAVRDKLMVLPSDTICYPGHNEPTTIEEERVSNPYL